VVPKIQQRSGSPPNSPEVRQTSRHGLATLVKAEHSPKPSSVNFTSTRTTVRLPLLSRQSTRTSICVACELPGRPSRSTSSGALHSNVHVILRGSSMPRAMRTFRRPRAPRGAKRLRANAWLDLRCRTYLCRTPLSFRCSHSARAVGLTPAAASESRSFPTWLSQVRWVECCRAAWRWCKRTTAVGRRAVLLECPEERLWVLVGRECRDRRRTVGRAAPWGSQRVARDR
jgi:hypothetical protein